MSEWQTIERPGYFGSQRDVKYREYDTAYGKGEWRIAWQLGSQTVGFDGVVMLYEDAYYQFLEQHPEVVMQLVAEASDVYDDAPSNVDSGLDYTIQETVHTHIQDIALRRCVVRLGEMFRGAMLIRIRDSKGDHPLSMTLSPGRVPFHRPDLICQPELEGWWQPGSVESFYQANKVLQVRTQEK